MRRDLMYSFKEYLKKPWFAYIIITGIILATLFFPSFSADLVLIICAFVLSDVVANTLVRGGEGIIQIRVLGNRTQYEGYGLIAFFISIVITSFAVDLASQAITDFALTLSSNLSLAVAVAMGLGLAVYGDMRVRFYWRSKTRQ